MDRLTAALRDLNEKLVIEFVDEMIDKQIPPIQIIDACHEGIKAVGEKYASGDYYLTDLMLSGEIMQEVMEKLNPLIASIGVEDKIIGTVVIGTVRGDIHDIGKNIVVSLLRSHGFKVIDLGVDVPTETFVKIVRTSGAKVLGLSALLNNTYPEMKNVINALKTAGLREKVKVIIGGTVVNESVREFTGADAHATDAITAIEFCENVYADKK